MRIQPRPISSYPWFARLLFWRQKRKYGKVLDPGLLWGRSASVFAGVGILYGMLDRRRSPLPPALRSLVTVRVSQINHCEFCVDINSMTLWKRGLCMDKVEAVENWRTSSLFDGMERASLDYAEAVTYTDQETTAAHFKALRQYFNDDEIAELTGLIAFQNMSSKFNAALDVPPQGFCYAVPVVDNVENLKPLRQAAE